ncbi:MAG: MBL fold metallo-hydrolase, partial [Patescibacteria group bacterium]
MKISKYLHSCILLEKQGTKLLFDPGTYSFMDGTVKPENFTNISAVFITHNHQDHYDPAALKTIVGNNPGVQIFSNPMTGGLLTEIGLPVEVFHSGEKKIGPYTVRAIPAAHEKTLLYPIPENTAYLVDGVFLHPGDSFNESMYGLKPTVLAFPIYAPWMTHSMALEFARG